LGFKHRFWYGRLSLPKERYTEDDCEIVASNLTRIYPKEGATTVRRVLLDDTRINT
jgi:hypothetical protein